MIILIGSRAVGSSILKRDISKSDYDLIINDDTVLKDFLSYFNSDQIKESDRYPGKYTVKALDARYEIDATKTQSNLILEKIMNDTTCTFIYLNNMRCFKVDIFLSLLIKRSHLNYHVNFEKNFMDYIKLIDGNSFTYVIEEMTVTSDEKEFYLLRKQEAKDRYGDRQKRINLKAPNEKFFKQSEHCRTFDHDNLHELIAVEDKPMYLNCKKDFTSAYIEMSMFDSLTHQQKLIMVQEEATVIGIERYLVDSLVNRPNLDFNELKIYQRGLMKLLKDLCKGKFQDFALDNAYWLWNNYIPFKEKLIAVLNQEKLKKQNAA